MQQALKIGGYRCSSMQVKAMPATTDKIHTLLNRGKILTFADSHWLQDIEQRHQYVYISDPIIRTGEYSAGLYVSAENTKALNTTAENIQQLSAISSTLWSVDWELLSSLNLKKLEKHTQWKYMAKKVHYQEVDFMLNTFQGSEDLSFTYSGNKFVPIPNVKVMLPDSRHFAVAKQPPYGEEFFNALNRGLRLMRENGTITRALTEANVLNRKTQDWVVLNKL